MFWGKLRRDMEALCLYIGTNVYPLAKFHITAMYLYLSPVVLGLYHVILNRNKYCPCEGKTIKEVGTRNQFESGFCSVPTLPPAVTLLPVTNCTAGTHHTMLLTARWEMCKKKAASRLSMLHRHVAQQGRTPSICM